MGHHLPLGTGVFWAPKDIWKWLEWMCEGDPITTIPRVCKERLNSLHPSPFMVWLYYPGDRSDVVQNPDRAPDRLYQEGDHNAQTVLPVKRVRSNFEIPTACLSSPLTHDGLARVEVNDKWSLNLLFLGEATEAVNCVRSVNLSYVQWARNLYAATIGI